MNYDKEKSKRDNLTKFLNFVLVSSGHDIVAPDALIREKMSKFSEIKSTSNDDVIDTSCVFAGLEPTKRSELIKVLSMQFLTVTQVIELKDWFEDYIKSCLEYVGEHPEYRESNPDKALSALRNMFGED